MDGQRELRAGLIPSGNCIPDESGSTMPALFTEIDNGYSDERKLVLAKEACRGCIQLQYCSDQTDGLATALWQRGAGMLVVGGSSVSIKAGERPISDEQPAFTFDLTTIPKEPTSALAVLRQGLRAGQLNVSGPTPEGVKVAASEYLAKLEEEDPDLHQKVAELEVGEVDKSLKYILTILFQQKDFASFSQGQRKMSRNGNPRYKPELFDQETDGPIVSHFLKETVQLRELGFSKVAGKAAYFGPEYFERLVSNYKKEATSWSEFETVIDAHKTNPITGLLKHYDSQDRIREQNPGSSEVYIRTAARLSPKSQSLDQKTAVLSAKLTNVPYLTSNIVRTVSSGVANPEKAVSDLIKRVEIGRAKYGDHHTILRTNELVSFARNFRTQKGYLEALEQYEKNFREIKQCFGDAPGMSDAFIRRFSSANLYDAVAAAERYQTCRKSLEEQSDGTVPPSMLNKCAARGLTSFAEVKVEHQRRVLVARFNQRKDSDQTLSAKTIERLQCLYPSSEVDAAAETAYALLNKGYLVHARAETFALGGQTNDDLDKIFSPKTHDYVTFSAVLRDLSPAQRLAFAHYHGLMPLLYGRGENTLQFEQTALGNTSLAEYYDAKLVSRLEALIEAQTETPQPISIMELSVDLAKFDELLAQGPERPLPRGKERLAVQGLRDATVVIAGKALYLHETGYAWDWANDTPDFGDWLQQKIAASYPPHQQEQAFEYTTEAINGGALELLGTSPGEYRLVFSRAFYDKSITELERASVANAMGIDRMLYGGDLTTTLQHRLGRDYKVVQIHRLNKPEIIEFTDSDLTAARAALELEILDIEAQEPLTQFVLTLFGGNYELTKLTEKQWGKIGGILLAGYSSHIENSNHQHEIQDPAIKAQVALAWTKARQGNVSDMARMFSVTGDDIDAYIDAGLLYIRAQLQQIPISRFKRAADILDEVAIDTVEVKEAVQPVAIEEPPEPYETSLPEIVVEGESGDSPVTATEQPVPVPHSAITPWATPTVSEHDNEKIEEPEDEPQGLLDIRRTYMRDVAKHKLLTAVEEVELAKAIEAGLFAQEKLDNGTYQETDANDLRQLAIIGDLAKQRMINSNLRLVARIAGRQGVGTILEYLDYVQEGSLGLMHAVEKFDYAVGYKFSTYATAGIRQAIAKARADKERAIRVPYGEFNREKIIARQRADYQLQHGTEPTIKEVADATKLSVKQIRWNDAAMRQRSISLQTPIGDGGELGQILYDEAEPSIAKTATSIPTPDVLNRVMSEIMTGKARICAAVLILYYGLELNPDFIDPELITKHGLQSGKAYTLDEVTAILGLTSYEATRGRRDRALAILRQPMVRRRIIEELDE